MKPCLSKSIGFVAVLTVGAWAGAPRACGQTGAGLGIEAYAGLSITGAVGYAWPVYSIEFASDLAQSNTPSAWRCLEFIALPASPYFWADKSAPALGKRFYRAMMFAAPTNMAFIPAGTFLMGASVYEVDRGPNDCRLRAVTISRGFWMGMYEVTQAEYLAVMGNNPSWFNGIRTNEWSTNNYGTDLTRPVETVRWDDATNYCAKLTERERGAGRIPTNCVYRLPTEAEWEYACRGWTSTRFSWGDDVGYTDLRMHAWYGTNSGGRTHGVGLKLPSGSGSRLFDMHGNVWEMCQDWSGDCYYLPEVAYDPLRPNTGSECHVIRGGSWWTDASFCRSASTLNICPYDPYAVDFGIGFRVVLAPGRP